MSTNKRKNKRKRKSTPFPNSPKINVMEIILSLFIHLYVCG